MEITSVIIFVLVGLFTGISSAVVGGGNLFIISVLGFTNLSALQVVATTQIISIMQDGLAVVAYEKDKRVNWKTVLKFTPIAIIGAYSGARLALFTDPNIFSKLIGIFMLFILAIIPRIKEQDIAFNRLFNLVITKLKHKRPEITQNQDQTYLLIPLTLLISMYGGFHGGAVGALLLLAFFIVGQGDILAVAATTKVINIVMAIVAAFIFISEPNLIRWEYAIPIIAGTLLGSILGVYWAEKLGFRFIRYLMYIIVFTSAIKYIL